MSDLGFLERLLAGAEVEWVPISQVFHVRTGYTPSKSQKEFWENGTVPWFRMDDIRANGQVLSDSIQKIAEDAVKGNNLFPANSLVFSTSATIGQHALITVPHLANQRFTNLTLKNEYSNLLLAKFLFYYGFILADWCKGNTTKSSFASVDMDGFRKFLIPIPCPDYPQKSLAIQKEIVRILDAFTELTTDLTTELTNELKARKKQYNHYRDQLLSLKGEEVEWKPLGEVCDFKNGFAFKSALFREDGLPIIRITNVAGGRIDMDDVKYFEPADYKENTEPYRVESGDILVAMSGATTGKIGVYEHDFPAYLNQRVGKFIPDVSLLNDRFLYHFLLSRNQQIYTLAGGGAQPNLSSIALKEKILVPVPFANDLDRSLQEQRRISGILDKLHTLTTSLSEGLPREIALRQQQYQYYRDLLLNFPKGAGA